MVLNGRRKTRRDMKNLILFLIIGLSAINAEARVAYNSYRMPSSGNTAGWGPIDASQPNALIGILPNANTTATSSNTSSTIVLRDGSGNFSCGTITAALNGNATTATSLAANPTDCGANTFATTIDAQGNLTCASVSLTAAVSGILPIANGGTGQATANAALNALLPSQTGNNTKVLQTDGTNTSWATAASGAVTSVALTAPSAFTVSGSPVTSSGTLALSYSGTAIPVSSGGTGATTLIAGFVKASGTSAFTTESTVQPTEGGTGLNSFSTGDTLYANAANSLTRLSACADGQVIKYLSGIPTCGNDNGNYAATDFASYSLTIGAATTPPTPGTSTSSAKWRRVGDSMEIIYYFAQTGAGSGGSGTYLFPLPNITDCGGQCLVDTSKITATTANANGNGAHIAGVANFSNGSTPSSSATGPGIAIVYNTSNIAIMGNGGTGAQMSVIGSSSFGIGQVAVNYSFSVRVPIQGWTTGTANSTGRLERVSFGGTSSTMASPTVCSISTCVINSQSPSITSVTRSATGSYSVNFSTPFSAAPICQATVLYASAGGVCMIASSTASAVTVFGFNATQSAAADVACNINCNGP